MKTRSLGNTGITLTELGLGGAPIANLYQPISEDEAYNTVISAWNEGVRYFDTAPYYGYGLSEIRLGKFLKSFPRHEYAISTKVGRLLIPDATPKLNDQFPESLPFRPEFDYSYDGVMRSVEDSLQRLNMSYIDIAYVHDIGRVTHGDNHETYFKTMLDSGYRALEDLRSQKVLRAIGVGANEWEVCVEAMPYTQFDCFMVAGRYTLLEQTTLEVFFPECIKRNISVIAAAPFNSGILASNDNPRYNYGRASESILNRARQIQEICQKYHIQLPHAAIHFPLLHPQVTSVVAGMRTALELQISANNLKTQIPKHLWEALKNANLLNNRI